MRTHLVIGVLVGSLLGGGSVVAQGTMPPDVRKKMSGYVGTWSFEERVKNSPTGPEKTRKGTWEARWVFESLIEWRSTYESDGKTTSNVEYEGYDPIMQGYSYWFSSTGARGHLYDGEWEGNTLRIRFLDTSPDGNITRGRCTWPYASDFSAVRNYSCEMLSDGRWWVFRSGSATKTKR